MEKDFGLFPNENDSLAVELKFAEYNNWRELLERTERIVCNDSLPKITIENDSLIKRVYFKNPCWEEVICVLTKQRNIIQIHNDTISKYDQLLYPLDSLGSVLRRDFENNGKVPSLSETSEKLMFAISYDNDWIERLPVTLKRLTKEYEKVTDSIVLKVWLNEKLETPPPPPPPDSLE
ncbi:hypothetical protein [Flagellimonas allohymeniacidonis]|uniref:Uncharacterized protein n=1 Tax=Flagellimonas allohymeniacidonis TaxID=2517819 RepID=A0A4Q8QKW6_9FLAO|nr:hypothetical protein [Allomuricauda hymeniacidonis]TAI48886.1 hypothetical protein EW142_03555 [Allomuricauda hymeniacidonis]